MGNAKRKQQASAEKTMSMAVPLLVALAIIIVAAIITFVVVGGDKEDAATTGNDGEATEKLLQETQPVTIIGETLPPYAEGDDVTVGKPAPKLTGESFDGTPVVIGGESTKPTLIFFFAHWCPHCQKELPIVQDWLSDSPPSDVTFVAVSTSNQPGATNAPPSSWFEREDWTTPVLADNEKNGAANAYGLSSFPFYVMLNSDGTVAARLAGERSVDELDDLIAEANS